VVLTIFAKLPVGNLANMVKVVNRYNSNICINNVNFADLCINDLLENIDILFKFIISKRNETIKRKSQKIGQQKIRPVYH